MPLGWTPPICPQGSWVCCSGAKSEENFCTGHFPVDFWESQQGFSLSR